MAKIKLNLIICYKIAFSEKNNSIASIGHKVIISDAKNFCKIGSYRPLKHPCSIDFNPLGNELAVKSTSGKIVDF